MLLVLLIAGFWTAGLLLVAGLCAAARRGDVDLVAEALAQDHAVPALAARAEPSHAAVRIAA